MKSHGRWRRFVVAAALVPIAYAAYPAVGPVRGQASEVGLAGSSLRKEWMLTAELAEGRSVRRRSAAVPEIDPREAALQWASDAAVCRNQVLKRAFEIIGEACKAKLCNIEKLGELDSRIEKGAFLGALRNPSLSPVHLFFPMNESEVGGVFDWQSSKLEQLASLS